MSVDRVNPSSSEPSPLRPVVVFFGLALLLTWGLQTPGVLAKVGILPGPSEAYMPFVVLGVFGPLLAAWISARRFEGAGAFRELLRGLYTRLPGVPWLVAALLTPVLLLSLGLLVHRAFTGGGALAYPPEQGGRVVAALMIAVGEETGWRGFALPRLSRGVGRLKASLVIGAVWTVWHIPMFVGQETPIGLWPAMFVQLSAGSVVFSWFYFKASGSLLVSVLMHIGVHLNNASLALPDDATPLIVQTIVWAVAAVALLVFDRGFWQRRA